MKRPVGIALLGAAAVAVAAVAVRFADEKSAARPGSQPYQPHGVAVTPAKVLTPLPDAPARATAASTRPRHYEYVFPDRAMYVYDIDRGNRLVEHVSLPQANGIRGIVADPRRRLLYISYGGDGGANGSGSLLKYDLVHDRILWERSYPTGIDSMAMSRDGRKLFMPTGEASPLPLWLVLRTRDGDVIGTIHGGESPHNTIVGRSGRYVYLGPRDTNFLAVARTSDGRIVRRIGPLEGGERPFTINGRETLAYMTSTGFLGFQVGSIRTGKVLYTVRVPGFHWTPKTFTPSAPSHGISLSPDERELWLIDGPNSAVHVYDVRGVPARAPRLVATIKLTRPLAGQEVPCDYDCDRAGWIQHSRDGRLVYVGDSGDVIDTRSRRVVHTLAPLYDTKKMIEIDWRNGVPFATTTRSGLGYVR